MLIADATFPLSSPAWGPDGHSLCLLPVRPRIARLEPESSCDGRCELVVQESVDRQRVIVTLPESHSGPKSACDLFRAEGLVESRRPVPRGPAPGPHSAILIVLPEQGRVLKTLERASLPSWSPDSSRMTFVRTSRDGSHAIAAGDRPRLRAWPAPRRSHRHVRAGILEPGRSIGLGGGPTVAGAPSKLRPAASVRRFGARPRVPWCCATRTH